eukprot:10537453-Ditylum_brightwellii.AAC.1
MMIDITGCNITRWHKQQDRNQKTQRTWAIDHVIQHRDQNICSKSLLCKEFTRGMQDDPRIYGFS